MPSGRFPASRASAIALNPKPELMSFDICGTVPSTSMARRGPARPPEIDIARMIEPPHSCPRTCRGEVEAGGAELEALGGLEQEPRDDRAMINASTKP